MDTLILVDLQNDFCPGGALAVPAGDRVVVLANRLQEQFPLVAATQDWHPADHGSFAANHPGKRVGEVIDLAGLPQVLWPVHCVERTPGAECIRPWIAGTSRGSSKKVPIRASTATAASSITAAAGPPGWATI